MALPVIFGRRAFMSLTINSVEKKYPLLGANISRTRNLIVPPVHSRDWQFLYTEGVRTAQIQLRIPVLKNTPSIGLDPLLLSWIFDRTANFNKIAGTLTVFDGNRTVTFAKASVQTATMTISKGDLVVWNIVCLATDVGTEVSTAVNSSPDFALPPVTWRDVTFAIGNPASSPYIYGIEMSIMNNLVMNAPIAQSGVAGSNLGTAIHEWSGGHLQAAVTLTVPGVNDTDIASLLADGQSLTVNFATSGTNTAQLAFRRLVPENPIDVPVNYGLLFKQIRFVVLGTPNTTNWGDAPVGYTAS